MPGNDVGTKSFGLPGRNFGGQGIAGRAEETMEERVQRHLKMGRFCRYCECWFIAEKDNQRFHDARCGMLARAGRIGDATFERWARGLRVMHDWNNGVDYPEDEPVRRYERPQDACQFDLARRRLFVTILEIQKRGVRSAPADQAKAFRMLADGLLALFTLPANVDLSREYDPDPANFATHVGEIGQAELPCRGFDAWRIVADCVSERMTILRNGSRPPDLDWLDV